MITEKKVKEKEWKEIEKQIDSGEIPFEEIPMVVSKREVEEWKIMRYKIMGDYVLEKSEFPANDLGIIFVGGEYYIDQTTGRQVTQSFFKHAKNPQKVLNYINSQIVDLIKKLRHEQWLATVDNVEGNLNTWTNPQNVQGALVYNPHIIGGQVLTPQKLNPSQISPSLQQEYNRVMDDISSCLGIYDTQLGKQGNELSGAAIDKRTRRGNLRTMPTYEMINLGISQVGNIILQMIPRVYDTHRIITVRTPDGQTDTLEVNIPPIGNIGKPVNGLTEGEFTISIQPGLSFEGQKEEYLHSLQTLLQANPQLFALVADKFAENLPMENTNEIANRLRSIVPDRVIQEGMGRQLPPEPEEPNPALIMLEKKIQEMENDMQIRQREMDLKEKEAIVDTKMKIEKNQLEQERIELQRAKQQLDAIKTSADIQQNKDEMSLKSYNSLIKTIPYV